MAKFNILLVFPLLSLALRPPVKGRDTQEILCPYKPVCEKERGRETLRSRFSEKLQNVEQSFKCRIWFINKQRLLKHGSMQLKYAEL